MVISNTTSVLTIDRWYNPATPTGSAGSTPSATAVYVILGGAAPVQYMALTTTGGFTPVATDTTLSAEYAVAGGGLIRQAATYAHTLGTNTYTLTATFTVNASDTGLPRTITGIGTFDTLTSSTGVMLHETALSATATLSAIGDALTVTQTVTM